MEHNYQPFKDQIKNVYCDVTNCVHHDGQKTCRAGQITVGPNYALTQRDTICSTFKCK